MIPLRCVWLGSFDCSQPLACGARLRCLTSHSAGAAAAAACQLYIPPLPACRIYSTSVEQRASAQRSRCACIRIPVRRVLTLPTALSTVSLQMDAHKAATLDGELVLLRASLDREHWMCWRCCQCVGMDPFMWFTGVPLGAALYGLLGRSCREAEADSFELVLTASALHYKQKTYSLGFCCQTTVTRVVPLDKIQDVVLVSDCCGDRCGFVPVAGRPYRLEVQTAGVGVQLPEVAVACINDIESFRTEVMAAKRRALGLAQGTPGSASGAAKYAAAAASSSQAMAAEIHAATSGFTTGADTAAVLAVLERIERAVTEGVGHLRSQQRAATVYPAVATDSKV